MIQTPPSQVQQNSLHNASDDDYCPELEINQYQAEVLSEITHIGNSEHKRVCTEEQLYRVEQCMLRVFDRSTVLLSIHAQTWDQDRTIVTEVGIAIYDPRGQQLALAPNIKNYHILISENRNCRNEQYLPDHSTNYAGGVSYLFTKAQTHRLVDGLMRHYFGPDFPLECLLVGHSIGSIVKAFEGIGIFIHPNVPRLDTQVLFSHTHGYGNVGLKNSLFTVNQPFTYIFNSGNFAYYSIMLALKLCDPMVRRLIGMDYLKENEKRDKPPKYKKREVNKSGQKTATAQNLIEEIVRVGVPEWNGNTWGNRSE